MDLTDLPIVSTLLDLTCTGLMALTTLLAPATGAFSAALAIVLVTLVVRTGLIPAGIAQAKAEQTRARLAPRLRDLQTRHRGNPERLQREIMALYRSEGASPFAGCLPIFIQAPIVGLLYSVFLHGAIAGHANDLLTQTLFDVPLGVSLVGAVALGTAEPVTWLVIGCLVLTVAAVGEVTRRLFRIAPVEGAVRVPTGLLGALQFATAVVALFVPLAAGLYLLTTVIWTLCQRLVLRRVYG
ncbi:MULTISPECIES: YidC/Oxa1 family membrane protein insertase [unclassified Microbacterium]|uniref:YidC/Oxa1 family membrane protein insertase n=1 Tax=unclassified Microbacterium TaxID=2609290 RepID=UPI00386D0EFF